MALSEGEIKKLAPLCYESNNRFAYKYDLTGKIPESELKVLNFVPTYDKWCLFCDKKECTKRCSICKTVYFCDKECQGRAWAIHKKHCGRNLFTICISCGSNNIKIKCEKCPVWYCGDKCKRSIAAPHAEFDCDHFIKIFQ
ncbi:MAG: putative ankyrin repeat and MYND domain-containing protein 2 [Harvfovirus sp.]|uniref:Putative ankyrin repeat and MYND domain-containing protein 2 n=1 Tax=Harvfovirus sp. TaxID=2487768 RepID=A0A3G5A1R0_9VIRU|nr:MAG: putative ankyrin repeat and MYND domain-containing protein 2 [Harvfovirus sp.]